MASYLDNIEDIYSKMYKTKEQQTLQKKQQSLADIEAQKTGVTNQYQELQNALKQRKQATASQYQGLYTNLNNQAQEGQQGYYQDRNNASVRNVQNVQSIRDYMARNNLMSSGENVDAMLRANTDLNNNLGSIYSNEQQFNRGIQDKRNSYLAQEQGAYGEIDNSLSAADREQAQKISDLMNRIRLTNEGYDSELMSYRDELESKKASEINAYNERLRQEELQKQQQEAQRIYEEQQRQIAYQREVEQQNAQRAWQEAQAEKEYQRQLAMQREQQAASLRAASARSSSSSSSASRKASKEQQADQVWSVFEARMNDGSAGEFLNDNAEGIIQNLGRTEYYKMKDRYEKARYGSGNGRYTQNRLNTRKQEETYNKMYEV